jgi:hypothetical protein
MTMAGAFFSGRRRNRPADRRSWSRQIPSLALAALAMFGARSAAAQNLVTNGSFTQFSSTPTSSFQFGTAGYTPPQTLTDWTSTGYNFVFLPSSTAATGEYGALSLWSPVSSPASANGFTNASPTGGNFVAADGDYQTASITQTINGLTIGQTYAVSFAWAGAQQSGAGYTSATSDYWTVSLLNTVASTSQSFNTPTVTVAGEGFSGWMNQSFQFTATNTSEELSFLATGTPAVPPFALLANVSMTVPEPSGLALTATAIAGLVVLCRRRRVRPFAADGGA